MPLGPITQEHWPVDWKIAMDNYLESYHVPIGHPGLYRMFTPDYDDQKGVPGVARGLSWMREHHSPRWAEGQYQRMIGKVATHLARRSCAAAGASTARCRISASMCSRTRWTSSRCCPMARDVASIRGAVFGLPDERREMRAVRYLSSRINTQVNNEDKWLCSRVQRGLASSSYRPGRCRSSSAGCWSFTTCCERTYPRIRA